MGNSGQFQPNDLTDQKHGLLTAIKPTGAKQPNGEYIWLVHCECGKDIEITAARFKRSKSCGCAMYINNSSLFTVTDFTGYETKHSIALYPTTKRSYTYTVWVMRCKHCGAEFETAAYNMTKGSATHKHCPALKSNQPRSPRKKFTHSQDKHTNILYTRYKYSALKREIPFELTLTQAQSLFQQTCTYCGAPPSITSQEPSEQYAWNGIDRIDNSLGYTLDNCVPCCATCNFAKGTKPVSDFRAWIKRICSYSPTT